jgi:hypothetical protein
MDLLSFEAFFCISHYGRMPAGIIYFDGMTTNSMRFVGMPFAGMTTGGMRFGGMYTGCLVGEADYNHISRDCRN